MVQEEEELYDDYATRLKQAAVPCEFLPDWRDIEIQLQLIEKGKSQRVRRRLLSKPHSLEEALDFARAQKLSDKQAKRIEMEQQHRGTNSTEEVYQVRPVRQKTSSKECFSCGSTFLYAGGRRKCPAWGKKCLACGRTGHFSKHWRNNGTAQQSTVKTVSQEVPSDSGDAESLCSIEVIRAVESNPKRRPIRRLKIENCKVNVLVGKEPR